jgi:WD40 repeat protein
MYSDYNILALYNEEDDNEEYSSETILSFPCLDFKGYIISDIAWNHNILAISYFIDNHQGPCSHFGYISFITIENDKFKAKTNIETNSCIRAIEAHPSRRHLFAACSYIGEVYLLNTSLEDQIQYISKIDTCFHKEPIVSVKWISYEKDYLLTSISDEGRILVWNLDDKLVVPMLGYNLKYKLGRTEMPVNPTAFEKNPYENNFIIGTLDGNIYKSSFDTEVKYEGLFQQSSGVVWRQSVKTLMCNMGYDEVIKMKSYIDKYCKDKNIIDLNAEEFFKLKPDVSKIYKNGLKSNFEKHLSLITSIGYNPFIKGLFASTSYDGMLRIYYNVTQYLTLDS